MPEWPLFQQVVPSLPLLPSDLALAGSSHNSFKHALLQGCWSAPVRWRWRRWTKSCGRLRPSSGASSSLSRQATLLLKGCSVPHYLVCYVDRPRKLLSMAKAQELASSTQGTLYVIPLTVYLEGMDRASLTLEWRKGSFMPTK